MIKSPITFAKASFRGVPFFVSDASEKTQWRHASYEFINDHEPEIRRYAKTAMEIRVDGYLVGKDAIFMKDLLSKACDKDEPGRLIHPLYGYKNAICVEKEFETTGVNSFSFSLILKEVIERDDSLLSKVISSIESVNDTLTDYALMATEALSFIPATVYAIDRATRAVLAIENALHTVANITMYKEVLNFLNIGGPKPAALSSTLVNEVKNPALLVERLHNAAKVVNQAPNRVALSCLASLLPLREKAAKEAKNDPLPSPEILIFEAMAFFILAEASKGDLGQDFAPAIEQLMEGTTNPTVFSFLWGLKNRAAKHTKVTERLDYGNEPSLVVSYQRFNSIDKAEELAHAAGQPFRV